MLKNIKSLFLGIGLILIFIAPAFITSCEKENSNPDDDSQSDTLAINPVDTTTTNPVDTTTTNPVDTTTTNPVDTTTTVHWDTVAVENPFYTSGITLAETYDENKGRIRMASGAIAGEERSFFTHIETLDNNDPNGNATVSMTLTYPVGKIIEHIKNSILPTETSDIGVIVELSISAHEGHVLGYAENAPIAISRFSANSIFIDDWGVENRGGGLKNIDTVDIWGMSIAQFIDYNIEESVERLINNKDFPVTISYIDPKGNKTELSADNFDAIIPDDENDAGTYEVTFTANAKAILERGMLVQDGQEYSLGPTPFDGGPN